MEPKEKKITPKKKVVPKKSIPKKKVIPKKKETPEKKVIPKKKETKKRIIIETDSNEDSGAITDEKYSEKLRVLITKIKNQALGESENKIRFAWKY